MKKAAALCLAAVLLAGCSTQKENDRHYSMNETVPAAWFDYTVTGLEAVTEYEGYSSAAGHQLVVVELNIKSTYAQPVTIFDSDFQLFWSGMAEEDSRCMPVEYYCDPQLPAEYELGPRESVSGVLLYQVPQEAEDFQLLFQEIFDDGTQEGKPGELYCVDLVP